MSLITLGLDRIEPTILPKCDYIYFATSSRATSGITKEIAKTANVIVAQAHNTARNRMPNVPRLKPGATILLAYGQDGRYEPVLRCTICQSSHPVRTTKHTFDVFRELGGSLHETLIASHYKPDPVIQRFVGITIETPSDVGHIKLTITKPTGNNTLRRWEEVFRT